MGTDEEEDSQIKMVDYLTYDEMQISALLGVSGPTPFINNGISLDLIISLNSFNFFICSRDSILVCMPNCLLR